MGNRKTKKRSSHRMECENKPKKKSLDVSEKYSESLIALNESSFKIRRFMNDVTSFRENPNHRTKRTIRHESEVKDKENVNLKSSLATKKSNNYDGSRTKRDGDSKNKFTFQGKKGLFENGVATKTRTFCRGLMPPIWNARLNADLRSILNLSCVDAPRRHAPSTSVAETNDDCFESTRSRSPDASVINSRLAKDVEKKTSSPKRSKNHQLESIFNDDDNDESLVHASCSQVGGAIASEPAADSEAADVSGVKSDLVSAVNLNDHYLRFTHCIVKSLSLTRFDREELESTSKKPVRFLAEFYRERLAQAQDEQNEEVESPALLPRVVSQNKENSQRSQPTLSQPTDYGAKSIRSDEWPTISRMKAQADEKFLKDSVISKGKIYTSGLKLLEAVYGQNNENNHQKPYNHLSVTPPKCTFSPIAEDIVSNSSFVNPVSGKKDWLPDFKSFSPPKAQLCTCCRRNNDCNFMNCTDESCRNNVLNYDLMTSGGGDRNEFKSCDFTCGMNSRGCWDGKSCFTNYKTVIKSERNLEKTLDSGRSRTAVSTADCLTILPPKSRRLERWRSSGLQTELRNKFEDSAVDTKDLLTLPLRLPALDSPDIQYYPRKMF